MPAECGKAVGNRVEANSRLLRGTLSLAFAGLLICGGGPLMRPLPARAVNLQMRRQRIAPAPTTSRTVQGLAPKGWKIDSSADV